MAVNYNELFNFLYSTRIPESLKDEVLNTVELPIQESIELPSYMYECVNFLDTLAYSNMSEELVNELIDSVFEGCSEEFMDDILEAYIKVKAYEYIVEGTAPVGLTGIAKENKAREEAVKRAEAGKEAVGKAVDTFKSKAAEVGNKAKEGIKAAVGKVKDWYNKVTQDRPIGLAKINNFKAQNKPTEAPKVEPKAETPKPEVKSTEAPKVEPKKEEPKAEQFNFLTKTGKVAKKFQAKEPETTRKIDTVKAEAPKKEEPKSEVKPTPEPKKPRANRTSRINNLKNQAKSQVVADTVAEEPKVEPKKEEPKPEVKAAPEPKKSAKKKGEIKIADRIREKHQANKVSGEKEAPKVETSPAPEPKKEEPKAVEAPEVKAEPTSPKQSAPKPAKSTTGSKKVADNVSNEEPNKDYQKLLKYTLNQMLKRAKTEEEKDKIRADYKRLAGAKSS